MSRIGKKPVQIPSGVTVAIEGQTVKVKGPKGELQTALVEHVVVKQEGEEIVISAVNQSKTARSAWGLSRTLVANMVVGVTDGFSKALEINGVGYRAAVQGNGLQLNLGYSHDVVFPIPSDVKIEAPKPTEIVVSGIDKQRVGQVAAEIRDWRRPEPYKGKGIKYADEYIFRKEGKKK